MCMRKKRERERERERERDERERERERRERERERERERNRAHVSFMEYKSICDGGLSLARLGQPTGESTCGMAGLHSNTCGREDFFFTCCVLKSNPR